MDENGQVYFGFEEDIPGADKDRYTDEVESLRAQVEQVLKAKDGEKLGILNTPGITVNTAPEDLTVEDIYAAVKKLEEPE